MIYSVLFQIPLMRSVHLLSSSFDQSECAASYGKPDDTPWSQPVQTPSYEEYTAIHIPIIVRPVYVLMEEGVVPSEMMEVVVLATMINEGRKAKGTCLWSGSVRDSGVPIIVCFGCVVLCVLMMLFLVLV